MSKPGRLKRWFKAGLPYLGITVVTLVLFDLVLIVAGVLPPTHSYGVPEVGWVASPGTGEMARNQCTEFASGETIYYMRNEEGYRTSVSSAELIGPGGAIEIAVTGDSHTDLCATNEETHFGYTESAMSEAGTPTHAFAYGAGRYSPLQAFIAVRDAIEEYEVDALVLNLYTGNDVYDMLRVDDRPYYTATDEGYEIADPVWYIYDPPGETKRSRVLFIGRSILDAAGVRGLLLRVRYLRQAAREQGQGFGAVLAYLNDLRTGTSANVGYAGAFTAQMLNQQLFFYRFPGSKDEGMARIAELLRSVRAAHPDLLLVLSPVPSYQLVGETPVDTALTELLDQLPISLEGGREEEESIYRKLADEADAAGWIFVDNLTRLQAYEGDERLFNDFDYHIQPVASQMIGEAQAAAILEALAERGETGGS